MDFNIQGYSLVVFPAGNKHKGVQTGDSAWVGLSVMTKKNSQTKPSFNLKAPLTIVNRGPDALSYSHRNLQQSHL